MCVAVGCEIGKTDIGDAAFCEEVKSWMRDFSGSWKR